MSNPSFTIDDRGLVPPGHYIVTLAEIGRAFGQKLRTSRRPDLFAKLRGYVAELTRAGWEHSLFIDGSFVMGLVDEPGDVDVIVLMPSGWVVPEKTPPSRSNPLERAWAFKHHDVELLLADRGSPRETEFIELFQKVHPKWISHFGWPEGLRKGLLRVVG
jgi:hypothetical protein